MEETAMRRLIEPELRRRWPDARIVHEPSLRYSSRRLDMAAIRSSELIGVEIKSSRDVADRLRQQIEDFAPVCSLIIVALAPCWNVKLPTETGPFIQKGKKMGTRIMPRYTEAQQAIRDSRCGHVEIWTVDAEADAIKVTDACYTRNGTPWPARMLDMLHVGELHAVMARHQVSHSGDRHDQLVAQCAELMTGREIRQAVCASLRAREAFAAGSDAPIGLGHGSPIEKA